MTSTRRSHRSQRPAAIATIAILALSFIACSPTGGLGTVPPSSPSPTPAPSLGVPDETAVPSDPGYPEPSDPGDPSPSEPPTSNPGSTPTARPTAGTTTRPTPKPTATPEPAPVETIIVRTYGILPGDQDVEGLVPTLQVVPETAGVARAALEQLLAGRLADGVSSAIPDGTRLLGLTIRDGVAIVDLSREFEAGGGSASAMYRLGQVVYTLTQFDTVGAVLFQIDGRTVTTFGPEGLVLDGPQTREDYVDLLPSIFVDRPAFGAALGNPGRVSGMSNVFEAAMVVTILDNEGRKLVDQAVMADCGSGCWGEFAATVPYDVDRAQWGTLRVWFGSAMDGRAEGVRDYPVWLTPAS